MNERTALRAHLEYSLYPELGLEAAQAAIVACARGDFDAEIEGSAAATVVAVLGLEDFVAARWAASWN